MADDRIEDVTARVAASAFHRWAGIRVTHEAPGEVEVALDVSGHHLNLVGSLHGGMIATVADTAMGLAVRTALPEGSAPVTAQMEVRFVAPVRGGTVLGRGRVVRTGRRAAFAEADVVDGSGELVARASATFVITTDDDAPG